MSDANDAVDHNFSKERVSPYLQSSVDAPDGMDLFALDEAAGNLDTWIDTSLEKSGELHSIADLRGPKPAKKAKLSDHKPMCLLDLTHDRAK